jgi:hypothetical protein
MADDGTETVTVTLVLPAHVYRAAHASAAYLNHLTAAAGMPPAEATVEDKLARVLAWWAHSSDAREAVAWLDEREGAGR